MFYNHTKRELRETQKLIKKLNQRHTSLTKKGYKNLPQTKEYEELFKKIGGEFGGRDHSTIMSSYEKMTKLIDKKETYQKAIHQIKEKLNAK